MFFHQNLMLILIFKIVSPKNVSLKSYKHLSGDQPPMHDLFANRYMHSEVVLNHSSKKGLFLCLRKRETKSYFDCDFLGGWEKLHREK